MIGIARFPQRKAWSVRADSWCDVMYFCMVWSSSNNQRLRDMIWVSWSVFWIDEIKHAPVFRYIRISYRFSPWDYGVHYSTSSRSTERDRLNRYLYFYGKHTSYRGFLDLPEIVIHDSVSLAHLKRIWVHNGSRDKVLSELRLRNLSPPSGRTWNEIVIEMNID